MPGKETVLLCQPEPLKGCSACCGLFNFRDISREHLECYLKGGWKRTAGYKEADHIATLERSSGVRDTESHICPFQGFISDGRPGCLIHPGVSVTDTRDRSLFGKKICDSFLCPAHTILTSEEKEILIRHTDDWYSYTVAIVDPESFQWILGLIRKEGAGPDEAELFTRVLTQCLLLHASYMNACAAPLFFYSVGEYNLGKRRFSVPSSGETGDEERQRLYLAVRGMLSMGIKNEN